MDNLRRVFEMLEKLGYDRFSFEESELPSRTTCYLYQPGEAQPVISATSTYSLDALREAARKARRAKGEAGQ